MEENQAEEYTSNAWILSSTGARSGLSLKYWVTPFGSELRWGTSEPGTAAMASSSSRNSAVRMLVSWRQNQRRVPTKPSFGWLIPSPEGAGAESIWSDGRDITA